MLKFIPDTPNGVLYVLQGKTVSFLTMEGYTLHEDEVFDTFAEALKAISDDMVESGIKYTFSTEGLYA